MKWGVFHPGMPGSTPEPLNAFVDHYGWLPRVINFYRDFDRVTPLLYPGELPVLRNAAAAMVTWEPNETPIASIAAGELDDVIDAGAEAINRYGNAVLVRFAHEMNGDWYDWGRDPDLYVAAWHHLVKRMRMHTSLARFVWCPNVIGGSSPELAPWWPGDFYVNWLGLDGYNWGGREWRSPYETFKATYDAITRLATHKPVVIAETASSEEGGDKARWIRNLPRALERMPRTTALCWFDKQIDGQPDWRIDSSPEARVALRAVAGR